MTDPHYYEVNLLWNAATQGTISSPGIASEIEVETTPKSPSIKKEKWTPEHLFIAALNSCLMTTFLLLADSSKFQFISFESNAMGKIEDVDGTLTVTEITLKPTLTIPASQKKSKAKEVLKMSQKACALTHSITTHITLEPNIIVQ